MRGRAVIFFSYEKQCGGHVAFTRIVSTLGQTALSANSFAITVESLCYMPAYGLAVAATTICGQCYGSGRSGSDTKRGGNC